MRHGGGGSAEVLTMGSEESWEELLEAMASYERGGMVFAEGERIDSLYD